MLRLFCTFLFTLFIINANAQRHNTATKHQPDFRLLRSDGKRINTSKEKGKVLIINFWATTCVPCLVEMPAINRFYTHFAGDKSVLLLSVDADDNFSNSVGYMQQHNFSIPVYNSASPVPTPYFRGVLPTTVVINKKGRIAKYYEGEVDYNSKDFIALITRLRQE
jgi:thiol-disulfide isomerase/thioredoxin